jgi:hypothetical protein
MVQTYMGYVLVAMGLIASTYSLTGLVLVIPGSFIAFTYSKTLIDVESRRIKYITLLFGIIPVGKWLDIKCFSQFNIVRLSQKYSTYSRGSVKLTIDNSFIRLLLTDSKSIHKIQINDFSSFEEAQKEKNELEFILFPCNDSN